MYIIPTKSGSRPKQITSGTDSVNIGFFSPKGGKIIFPRDKSGNEIEQIFLYTIEKGDVKQLTKNAYRTIGINWHPNGKEVTRAIITQKGCGLESINVESGECFMLKESLPILEDISYSHDGKWIASTADVGDINEQIYIINRNNPEDIIIYSIKDNSKENLPSWSPNDKKLAFRSEATGQGRIIVQEFQGEDQFILDINDGEEVSTTDSPVWNTKSDTVYYIVSKHARHTLHAHPIDEEKKPALPFPEGVVAIPKISKGGKILVAIHSSMTSPYGIYFHELGSNLAHPLTPRDFDLDLSLLSNPQSIWYKTFDEKMIHSWYIPASTTSKFHPAIVWVHGGPAVHFKDEWIGAVVMHTMSQNGIAIFIPNYRGSTGYGSEFENLVYGDLGGGDLEDIIYGANWLRIKSEIDKTKIALMGNSYGGYLTLMALTKKPNVFTAGVSIVPITDWIEQYRLSDPYFQHYIRDLFGGIPKEMKQLYLDRSPITHVSNIKAPVMIIAGKHDSRCPIEPIERFIEKLKEKNQPYEFLLEEKAGHLSFRLNREKMVPLLTKIIEFLKTKFY